MPSYLSNDLIRETRERKRVSQQMLLHPAEIAQETLSRIENNRQSPKSGTFQNLMDNMKFPVDTFFCPYLENQTLDMIQMRDELLYYLSHTEEYSFAISRAESIINTLEQNEDFAQGINRQFVVSCKATLRELKGEAPGKTIELVKEGIAITFPEYNEETFEGDMLIFDEISLLHTKAKTYKRGGELADAARLLEHIREGIQRLPQDNRDKEQYLAPILLTLSKCYIETGSYKKALETCEEGYATATKRNKGFLIPDFVHHKANCLTHMGQKSEAIPLLRQSYFGYKLMRRHNTANNLWQYTKDELGLHIQTYFTDTLQTPLPEPKFAYGNFTACQNIGQLISKFRDEANLTLWQLCEGVCTESTLTKIMFNKIESSVYILEAIMERLGRDINKYLNTFPSVQDFRSKQLRDEAVALGSNRKWDEKEQVLNLLAQEKPFREKAGLQFIEYGRMPIYKARDGFDSKVHLQKLLDALAITKKDLKFSQVADTRFTFYEVTIINQIANNLCNSPDTLRKGLRLFEDLIQSMDTFYVDETAKMRMYTTILYNYTKYLYSAKRYEEVLPIADYGEELSIKHGQFKPLPGFAVNRATSIFEMGGKDAKEKSLPYFALNHYGNRLLPGRREHLRVTSEYVDKHLGIVFI